MEERKTNDCNFINVAPIMMDLPYPPLQVKEKNPAYAKLLSVADCGAVSERSAITQYINNENRLSCEKCEVAKTILGIAMAEMIHLQKLGELIVLLGGKIDFAARNCHGESRMWTPEYLTLPDNPGKMLVAGVESERDAIHQYRMHMRMMKDPYVNATLARIIKDEEYHIMMLQTLMKDM